MPELPEVESVRLGLAKVLKNLKIIKVTVSHEKIVSSHSNKREANKNKTKEFIQNLEGKTIENIIRRAKNLIIILNDDSVILVHLKMTGQMVFATSGLRPASPREANQTLERVEKIIGGHPILESYKESLPNKHTHVIIELADLPRPSKGGATPKTQNSFLYYNDVRKFGYMLYYKNLDEAIKNKHFEGLGLEPFDKIFTEEYFREEIRKKKYSKTILKKLLLEQKVVVGCGNIYTDEVCFASRVLPQRKCGDLSDNEIKDIYKNIKIILQNAIDAGGSSISDYLLADGTRGNYARSHKVYGRAGEKCLRCKNILKKEMLCGRATVFCGVCQK